MTTALFFLLFLILISVALAARSLAPWVPCRKKDLERIFRLANLRSYETFYDLGCGNGRVIFYAAKLHQLARVKIIGIELAWPLFALCRLRQLIDNQANVRLKCKSLFNEDLPSADVVYVFGIPKTLNSKLRPKLERELRPGSRVLSYVFPIEGWTPRVIDKSDEHALPIYLYVIK